MEAGLKERFLESWQRHFPGAELPIAFWYTDGEEGLPEVRREEVDRCLIANLRQVRAGTPLRFTADSIGCAGGRRYCGFATEIMPNFEYFLSTGIPGKLEGERYKKSPELVSETMARAPRLKAPARSIVFKRWDQLAAQDDPAAVVFFARPDVLAGLFTLANYDRIEPTNVIAPFAAGCGTVVQYPYLEQQKEHPSCIIGMFDPSARPYMPENAVGFAVPMKRFTEMAANMDESFLITGTWEEIRKRIAEAY